jgi:mycothiol synthase
MHGSTTSDSHGVPDLVVRAASPDDLADITGVLDACSQQWDNRPTFESAVADRLAQPGASLADDTVVVAAEHGRMLAFGHTWPTGTAEARAFGRVHPGHRGQGVGTVLVRELLARARRHAVDAGGGAGSLTTTTPALDPTAGRLLAANGFAETRFVLQMVSSLDAPRPDRRLGGSVSLRTFRPGADEDALFEAFNDAFADHWGFEAETPESWWYDHRDSADAGMDPSMWFLAVEDGEVAGFSMTKVGTDDDGKHGYVSLIGVRPRWRGHGVGYALLDRSLEEFAARGLARAKLDVDAANVTDALRLYRKAGMTDRPSFTIWTAPL